MFDTMNIAKKIKQARIDKNMTQMNLADELGVSYQAVSNWERGNSMPDISKLGDLCAALDITVNELLGIEAPAVTKAMEKEELTMEELVEVAPVLPPAEVKEKTEKAKKKRKLDMSKIADMAAYLDEEFLSELVLEAAEDSLDGIDEIACHLNEDIFVALAEKAKPDDLENLAEAACHMGDEALNRMVRRCVEAGKLEVLEDIACFMSEETLDALVCQCEAAGKMELVTEIACFLSDKTLSGIVDWLIDQKFDPEELDWDVSELYPFMGTEPLRKLAKYLMQSRDLDALEDMMEYL